MHIITLRNVPNTVYEQLKETASLNHRSLNGEVLSILEKSFSSARKNKAERVIERARKLRNAISGEPLTDELLTLFKEEGRE